MDNRIEEVKKMTADEAIKELKRGTQQSRSTNNQRLREALELGIEALSKECQLIPQPLDKELREKCLLTDEEMGYAVLSVAVADQWCFRGDILEGNLPSYRAIANTATDKALALLQPKIEEAKREERERIHKIIIDCTLEQGRSQFQTVANSPQFLQALKGGK